MKLNEIHFIVPKWEICVGIKVFTLTRPLDKIQYTHNIQINSYTNPEKTIIHYLTFN